MSAIIFAKIELELPITLIFYNWASHESNIHKFIYPVHVYLRFAL